MCVSMWFGRESNSLIQSCWEESGIRFPFPQEQSHASRTRDEGGRDWEEVGGKHGGGLRPLWRGPLQGQLPGTLGPALLAGGTETLQRLSALAGETSQPSPWSGCMWCPCKAVWKGVGSAVTSGQVSGYVFSNRSVLPFPSSPTHPNQCVEGQQEVPGTDAPFSSSIWMPVQMPGRPAAWTRLFHAMLGDPEQLTGVGVGFCT